MRSRSRQLSCTSAPCCADSTTWNSTATRSGRGVLEILTTPERQGLGDRIGEALEGAVASKPLDHAVLLGRAAISDLGHRTGRVRAPAGRWRRLRLVDQACCQPPGRVRRKRGGRSTHRVALPQGRGRLETGRSTPNFQIPTPKGNRSKNGVKDVPKQACSLFFVPLFDGLCLGVGSWKLGVECPILVWCPNTVRDFQHPGRVESFPSCASPFCRWPPAAGRRAVRKCRPAPRAPAACTR